MRLRPALAAVVTALVTALAFPAAAAPAPRQAASDAGPVMTLHYMVGTGACATAHTDTARVDDPCWLQFGLLPAVRLGPLELGLAYEGRDLLKWVSFKLLQPPAVTMVGASAAWIHEPNDRWRLSAGAEGGWRRYMDFAGTGTSDRSGSIDVPYLGAVGRAALGVRPGNDRTDRLEVSVAVRADLKSGHATVDGVDWTVGGWSFTMSLGLVSEW